MEHDGKYKVIGSTDELVRHLFEVHKIVAVPTDMRADSALVFNSVEKGMCGIGYHDGYRSAFTREQVPGAILNGTRIVKVKCEEGDTRLLGVKGAILGSVNHPPEGIGYFVEWDDAPKLAVFVIAWKIERA